MYKRQPLHGDIGLDTDAMETLRMVDHAQGNQPLPFHFRQHRNHPLMDRLDFKSEK